MLCMFLESLLKLQLSCAVAALDVGGVLGMICGRNRHGNGVLAMCDHNTDDLFAATCPCRGRRG